MKQIQKIMFTGLLALGSFGAHADVLSVACYGDGHGFSVYVDPNDVGLTASYGDLGFTSVPNAFGKPVSYTTVERTANQIKIRSHVITGNPIDVVFDSDLTLILTWNADTNHYYPTHVELYRLGVQVPVAPFTSADTCYVQ